MNAREVTYSLFFLRRVFWHANISFIVQIGEPSKVRSSEVGVGIGKYKPYFVKQARRKAFLIHRPFFHFFSPDLFVNFIAFFAYLLFVCLLFS